EETSLRSCGGIASPSRAGGRLGAELRRQFQQRSRLRVDPRHPTEVVRLPRSAPVDRREEKRAIGIAKRRAFIPVRVANTAVREQHENRRRNLEADMRFAVY